MLKSCSSHVVTSKVTTQCSYHALVQLQVDHTQEDSRAHHSCTHHNLYLVLCCIQHDLHAAVPETALMSCATADACSTPLTNMLNHELAALTRQHCRPSHHASSTARQACSDKPNINQPGNMSSILCYILYCTSCIADLQEAIKLR